MVDQLIDESIQKPSLRFWLIVTASVTVIGAALLWGYSYLFPSQSATLSLNDLSSPTPQAAQEVSPQVASSTSAEPVAPSSSLVSAKDTVSGFQVSHPPKWTVQSQDSFVLLRSDECGETTVLFYPTQLLGSSQKPTELLEAITHTFIDQLKDDKQLLTLGSAGAEGEGGATALLSGTVCGSDVTGSAQLTTQGNRALLKLSWYPASLNEQLTNTINQVLQSYKSVMSTATFAYQGAIFQVPVPGSYLFEETDNGASVHSGDRLAQIRKIDFAADQPLDAALDAWLLQEKDAGRELAALKVESSTQQSGDDAALNRYNTKTRFITYTKGGTAFQGVLTAAYTDALGNSALILWRSAPRAQWALAEPTLLLIEQGATYQPGGQQGLTVPVYATWRDASPLTGTSIRTSLNSSATQVWQSLILKTVQLTDTAGARYVAPLNALNPETGTFGVIKDGTSITLQVTKPAEQ